MKARVYKRRFKIDYTCFDDIVDKLDPAWTDPKSKAKFAPKMKMIFGSHVNPEDLSRPLEVFETSDRCLKSIRFERIGHKVGKKKKRQTQSFLAVDRNAPIQCDRQQTEKERTVRKL